jgi:DNA-binding NarL/FixJ family response regulator
MLRILIADDHEMIRQGICTVLSSRHDIEVCAEAANGLDAVAKFQEIRADLVILDVTMPVMDGIAAAKEIRKIDPDVPILLFSMHDRSVIESRAQVLGVQGYVMKSEAVSMLLTAVDALACGDSFFGGKVVPQKGSVQSLSGEHR